MARKQKHKKEVVFAEPGTFKHSAQTRMTNPFEFYRLRLEYLKRKREQKRKDRDG